MGFWRRCVPTSFSSCVSVCPPASRDACCSPPDLTPAVSPHGLVLSRPCGCAIVSCACVEVICPLLFSVNLASVGTLTHVSYHSITQLRTSQLERLPERAPFQTSAGLSKEKKNSCRIRVLPETRPARRRKSRGGNLTLRRRTFNGLVHVEDCKIEEKEYGIS